LAEVKQARFGASLPNVIDGKVRIDQLRTLSAAQSSGRVWRLCARSWRSRTPMG